MPKPMRTAPCSASDARIRLGAAQAYLEVARQVLAEPARSEYLNVAAGLAVLSGIAASDAICGAAWTHSPRRGPQIGSRLAQGGYARRRKLATQLGRLLSLKDAAHYGVQVISSRNATDATKWASRLVERARDETER